jgi:hypothetical protein
MAMSPRRHPPLAVTRFPPAIAQLLSASTMPSMPSSPVSSVISVRVARQAAAQQTAAPTELTAAHAAMTAAPATVVPGGTADPRSTH